MSFFNVMHFHSSQRATKMNVCSVADKIGYDAWGYAYNIITDDFGNIVFVSDLTKWVKQW